MSAYTIEEMERWSNDPRTRELGESKYRYVRQWVETRDSLRKVLVAIDEGLTEADVELAVKTVTQERATAQQEREAASILRGEKAAAITKLADWQKYVDGVAKMLGGGAPLAVLVKRLQGQLTEARASLDRAVEASNADLEKRRDAVRSANNWEGTARREAENVEYYRGLLVAIGEMFGEEARTQDDGGKVGHVLAAKVPELVASMKAKLEEFTTNLTCGHPRVALDDATGGCLACERETRWRLLEEVVSALRKDDHLYATRQALIALERYDRDVALRDGYVANANQAQAEADDSPDRKCGKCDGCGRVADTTTQEPWTAWMGLTLGQAASVVLGVVKPIPCPECDGSGKPSQARVEADDSSTQAYPFVVYPGSEHLDLGPKGAPQVLCRTREQADHMRKFWGEGGYVEEVLWVKPAGEKGTCICTIGFGMNLSCPVHGEKETEHGYGRGSQEGGHCA